MTSLEELYGHFTNYRKMKDIGEDAKDTVNLYAMTHHFPESLFSLFEKKGLLNRTGERSYDLNLLTPVRFVITKGSDHPVLGLFSDDAEQVMKSRIRLEKDNWLLREVSSYLGRLYEHYLLEGIDMPYTQEMFIKDHHPDWYAKIQAGMAEGEARGRVTGEILMAQRLLKVMFYSQEELKNKSLEELKEALERIETEFSLH